jgi:hypothetical protein
MQKYLTISLIFVAIGLIAGAYYKGQQAGADAERAEWQARDLARQAEIQKLQDERDQARLAAEQAKARIEVKTVEVIRESRQIIDECADTAVTPGLLRLYTH